MNILLVFHFIGLLSVCYVIQGQDLHLDVPQIFRLNPRVSICVSFVSKIDQQKVPEECIGSKIATSRFRLLLVLSDDDAEA